MPLGNWGRAQFSVIEVELVLYAVRLYGVGGAEKQQHI